MKFSIGLLFTILSVSCYAQDKPVSDYRYAEAEDGKLYCFHHVDRIPKAYAVYDGYCHSKLGYKNQDKDYRFVVVDEGTRASCFLHIDGAPVGNGVNERFCHSAQGYKNHKKVYRFIESDDGISSCFLDISGESIGYWVSETYCYWFW